MPARAQWVRPAPPLGAAGRRQLTALDDVPLAGLRIESETVQVDLHATSTVVLARLRIRSDADRQVLLGYPEALLGTQPSGIAEPFVSVDGEAVRLGYDEWDQTLPHDPQAFRPDRRSWTAWWTWETQFQAHVARAIEIRFVQPRVGQLHLLQYALHLGRRWRAPRPDVEISVDTHGFDTNDVHFARSLSHNATPEEHTRANEIGSPLNRGGAGRTRIQHRVSTPDIPSSFVILPSSRRRLADVTPPQRGLDPALRLLDRVERARTRDLRLRGEGDRPERARHWTRVIEELLQAACSREPDLRSTSRWILWSTRAEARRKSDEAAEVGEVREEAPPDWLTSKAPRDPPATPPPPVPLHLISWLTPEGDVPAKRQRDDVDCGSANGVCREGPKAWPIEVRGDANLFVVTISRERARRPWMVSAAAATLAVASLGVWIVMRRRARR